jgi:hypothetical protein
MKTLQHYRKSVFQQGTPYNHRLLKNTDFGRRHDLRHDMALDNYPTDVNILDCKCQKIIAFILLPYLVTKFAC